MNTTSSYKISQLSININGITRYFTVGTRPSSVKGACKHLQSLHTNISHVLSLTLAEIDNETLFFKPAYGLEVFTDHQQRSGVLVCSVQTHTDRDDTVSGGMKGL